MPMALQVLRFFKEFLAIARTSTSPSQLRLYQGDSLGRFVTFIEKVLKTNCPDHEQAIGEECRVIAVDLLLSVCSHDPQALRQCILDSCKCKVVAGSLSGGGGLLSIIIDCFLNVKESGVRWQLVHLLRTIVDCSPSGGGASSLHHGSLFTANSTTGALHGSRLMDEILNLFYPTFASRLLQPFVDLNKSSFKQPDRRRDDILFHLCDLLIFFINAHKFRIKYLLLRSFIIQNVILLLASHPQAVMRAAALRVFRTMIGTQDDFYYRFFVKHNSFRQVIQLFKQVDGRNNILESALFELFEVIRAGQSRVLINHLMEQHGRDLSTLSNNVYQRLADVYGKLNPNATISSRDDYFERLDDSDGGDGDDGGGGGGGGVQEEEGQQQVTSEQQQQGPGDNEPLPRPYSPSKRSKLQ